jgi:hypothetical protein
MLKVRHHHAAGHPEPEVPLFIYGTKPLKFPSHRRDPTKISGIVPYMGPTTLGSGWLAAPDPLTWKGR